MTTTTIIPDHYTSTDPDFAGRTWILKDQSWDWRHPVILTQVGDELVDVLRVETLRDWPEWIPRDHDPRSLDELIAVLDVLVGGPVGWDLIPSDVASQILGDAMALRDNDS